MKKEIDSIDVTPKKNIFRSIIADYNAQTAICELIDNAIDLWVKKDKKYKLLIDIEIRIDQQLIRVRDNSGGIKKEDLSLIVGPGHSGNLPEEQIIGIFGVGSKRAVVALAQHVTIKSRYRDKDTYQIEFDDDWLKDESWELPVYIIEKIENGTTIIELTKLREVVSKTDIGNIQSHISATYGKFLKNQNLEIVINKEKAKPSYFDNKWSFNPDFSPKAYSTVIKMEDRSVNFTLTAGLLSEGGDAGYGDYGLYVYCNDRLIARALKSFEVGFTQGKVGVPHGSISLVRVIIEFNGEANHMPWNSSKSGIDTKHKLFLLTRDKIIEMLTYHASLCRRLNSEREAKVFPFKEGKIQKLKIDSIGEIDSTNLTPLPKTKPREADLIKKVNAGLGTLKPWTVGLYESIIAAQSIFKQRLDQKNRIALIVTDSNLEIGFKEYLLNESGETYSEVRLKDLFKNRSEVVKEVQKHIKGKIKKEDWDKITYFYRLRCDLVHSRADTTVTDRQIIQFLKLAKNILSILFGIKFK